MTTTFSVRDRVQKVAPYSAEQWMHCSAELGATFCTLSRTLKVVVIGATPPLIRASEVSRQTLSGAFLFSTGIVYQISIYNATANFT